MAETRMSGIEQGRAKFAYTRAYAIKENEKKEEQKKYKSYVKNIPMLIKTNGLAATFAFVFSKMDKEKPYQWIYQQTTDWLKQDQKHLIHLSEKSDLVQELIQLKTPQYRAVTIEVLALFTWLKRFADGLIEGEAS